jgi:hypothetical protein
MRFWTGANVAFGSDYYGPGVIIAGPLDGRVSVPGNDWTLAEEKSDGTLVWRPVGKGVITRIQKPVADDFAVVLADRLQMVQPAGIHPALANGLAQEARRLYPKLDRQVERVFQRFVAYLNDEFGVSENTWAGQLQVPFVDGFGPELLVYINDRITALPELPPVVSAPEAWRRSMWWASNYMVGPNLAEEVPASSKLQFPGLAADLDLPVEGLVYYQSARAMAAWAAWENDPTARFLQSVMAVVLAGFRPLSNS